MKKLKSLVLMALTLLPASKALAQTNAQVLYDFGTDRKYVTLTLEMFKQDKWGSTYFFVDHDFNYDKMDPNSDNVSLGGTYTEISRALNFWKDSSLKNWSLHAEYNGGITKNYPINNAWLFGVVIIALKQYRLYHSNDTASLAWLQASLFTWLAIPV